MAPTKLIAAGAIAFATARFSPLRDFIGPVATFLGVFVAELLLNFVYACFIYPFYVSPLRHLPGPKGGHPLWGHGMQEMRQTTPALLNRWKDSFPDADFIRFLGFFGEEKVVPITPEAVRQVFTNESIGWPAMVARALASIIGDGLIFMDGVRHKTIKKQVGPAFTPSQQRYLVPAFWEVAMHMNNKIKEALLTSAEPEVELNMDSWTSQVTFDMIGRTAWGCDFHALEDPSDFFTLFDRNYPAEPFTGFDAFLTYVLPIFVDFRILNMLPFKRYQQQLEDRRSMANRFREIIKQSREKGSEMNEEGNHKDLLSSLLACNQLEEYDLMENMQTFTTAGYGTNAATLVWATYILGTHPEVQSKLRAEVREILKTPETPVTSVEMDAMPYLHNVVMEIVRLFPAVHTTWRTPKTDVVVLNTPLPKDTMIIMSPFMSNRRKAVWGEDAADFKPERWEPENRVKGVEHNGNFLSYAIGRKVCIGKEYSLRAMKATLIALASDFELSYEGKNPLKHIGPGGTLRVNGGLNVKVRMAEPW